MAQEKFYEVLLNWQAGRQGIINSPVLNTTIAVATPPQFPKGIEGIWSPEHLFVAAVNSCFMTTFLAVAENSKLEFVNFESKAIGKLEQHDGKYWMNEITLMPIVTMEDNQAKKRMEIVLQKAEANCIISNSIKSKINFKPEVRIAN